MVDNKDRFKTQLKTIFNPVVIANLGQTIKQDFPAFNSFAFEQEACKNLDSLELKQRSLQICAALDYYLPTEFQS